MTGVTDEFDLGRFVRDAISRSRTADPYVLARRIAPRIPAGDRDRVFGDLLAQYVRIEFGRMRMRTPPPSSEPGAASSGAAGSVGRSRWSRWLQQPEFVDGAWKHIGECTADDLDWLAADHERKAAQLSASADRFRGLAERVRAAGVATLADLYSQEDLAA